MVRDVFRKAKENAPSIIFIDEVDAIATKRFDANTGADREVTSVNPRVEDPDVVISSDESDQAGDHHSPLVLGLDSERTERACSFGDHCPEQAFWTMPCYISTRLSGQAT